MDVVIFDGMSGSGKSTIREAVIKLLEYNVMTIDRFSPSIWVYDSLRGNDRREEIEKFEMDFDGSVSPLLVICYCDPEIAAERDVKPEAVFGYVDEMKKFIEYLNGVCQYKDKMLLDSGTNDVDACALKVKERLDAKNLRFWQ